MIGRRSIAALGALLLLCVLSGCATIPTSGAVQQNTASRAPDGNPTVAVIPNPPADGADPQEIVRGFVLAESAGGDYHVAKEFLTQGFAATWQPDARALVHVDSWDTTAPSTDRVVLRLPVVARVASTGVFTPVTQTQSLPFRLERVSGQWRIAAGPTGVVLSQRAFLQRGFVPVTLQFWDPGFSRFVPDLRWFPNRDSQATATVRALLDGPAEPLRGVAVSALPSGTQLAAPVTVSGGLTRVSITVPGEQPDRRATDRMQQQIAKSLPVPTSSIRLTVDGRTAVATQQADVVQPSTQEPVVLSRGRFGTLSSAGLREDTALGPRIVQGKPSAITVSDRQKLAAVLNADGAVARVDRSRSTTIDDRPGLIAPALDQNGWIYSVPRDDPRGLVAVAASGTKQVRVQTNLRGTEVLAIEVSTDGTRMLVLVQTDTGPEAYVAGILRAADGTPIGLTSAQYPVALEVDGAVDATWVDQTHIAVLTSGAPLQNVIVQQVGGVSNTLAPLSNAEAIVGATSQNDLRALLSTGVLYQYPTNVWQSEFLTPVAVSVLAVQR